MGKIRIAKDFRDFLKLFLDHEVRFMVIGGYAVVHHSRPRFTGDLDLWVGSSPDNAARVVKALREFGLRGEDVVPNWSLSRARSSVSVLSRPVWRSSP